MMVRFCYVLGAAVPSIQRTMQYNTARHALYEHITIYNHATYIAARQQHSLGRAQ